MTSTPRRALAALALASSLMVSAGCAVMSPVQTDVPYAAGDGVNLTMSKDFQVRGLLVVGGTKEGGAGRLTGQFVNHTAKTVTVTFATKDGASVKAEAKAGSTDLAAENLVLTKVPAKAGDLVEIAISAQGSNDVTKVPVLLPQGAYKEYAPQS